MYFGLFEIKQCALHEEREDLKGQSEVNGSTQKRRKNIY
jgi:hypothetical protein